MLNKAIKGPWTGCSFCKVIGGLLLVQSCVGVHAGVAVLALSARAKCQTVKGPPYAVLHLATSNARVVCCCFSMA